MVYKKIIQKILNNFGYQISKKQKNYDLPLYEMMYGSDASMKNKLLNIGAANFYHPYWTNVDFVTEWYSNNKIYTNRDNIDISYDLMSLQPIPVESNSVKLIYCSHVIEHISNNAAQNLFDESFRILEKNGIMRFLTPDIDLYYNAYLRNDRKFFYWVDSTHEAYKDLAKYSIDQNFLFSFASVLSTASNNEFKKISDEELKQIFQLNKYEDALNCIIEQIPLESNKKFTGLHMNWWNYEKISSMLKNAGFNSVKLSGFGKSASPILRDVNFFDNTHPKISLFVEVIK